MSLWDRFLDASIVRSFDRTGFERHARGFDPAQIERPMHGRVCLVTGANRGLGRAAARGLAERGAQVHLLCRDQARGDQTAEQLKTETNHADIHAHAIDLASLRSIQAFVARFEPARVDVLVHNAGLLPATRSLSPEGLEQTVAVHVVGPHALTRALQPRLGKSRGGGRVIVVSSGGMYAKRLDVGAMLATTGRYDGVSAYAMTKRAQVVLAEQWARALEGSGTVVHAMHPGWAATEGVQTSLPRFWRTMQDRLRTPAQGADTVLWLAMAPRAGQSTGGFWFDRASAPTHPVPFTRESPAQRERLWALVERYHRRMVAEHPQEIDA